MGPLLRRLPEQEGERTASGLTFFRPEGGEERPGPLLRALLCLAGSLAAAVWPDFCLLCGACLEKLGACGVCGPCLRSIPSLLRLPGCPRCGYPLEIPAPPETLSFCPACSDRPVHFSGASSYGEYAGSLRILLHQYKFGRQIRLSRPLAGLLLAAYQARPEWREADVICHVPLHRTRRRQRGFDQAELLAGLLAEKTGLLHRALLQRTGCSGPQSALSLSRRETNVRGAYAVRCPEWVKGKRVLLVDDVMTTGATMEACALALERAGADAVWGLSVARVRLGRV